MMEEIRNDFMATEKKQDDMLIRVQGLSKSYGAKRALDHIDLNIGRGKIVGLLGPNGSGKTTFIKLLNGLLRPNEGILLVNGYAPGVETKSIISYLPDRMYFADWMKTVDLMDLFSDFYADFDRQKAAEMFSALNIRPLDRIKSMSKGTKEKVQLVLVMSRKAQLYLLDEPIAGVDPAARDFILDTISNACSMRLCFFKMGRLQGMIRSIISAKQKESLSISCSAKCFVQYLIKGEIFNVWKIDEV